MEEFDVIVIGGGSGLMISSASAEKGLKTAVIEKGPLGGTCLNRGCIPSKIIIHSAAVANTISSAKELGISANITSVDFKKVTGRASKLVDAEAKQIEKAIRKNKYTTLFKTQAKFIGPKTLKVGSRIIKGKKIFIAAGTRPHIPPIHGLKDIDYMTSKEALRLKKLPQNLTIIGGGFIAAELAHFFSSFGSKVTIVQFNDIMIPKSDREIAKAFTRIISKKCRVLLNSLAYEVEKKGKTYITSIKNQKGSKKRLLSDKILVATGRISNADTLEVKKTGIKTDKRNFCIVNDYMETNVKGIWALGDIAGKYMFKHSANLEAQYAYHNAFSKKKMKINYKAMPQAIFSDPELSGVGETEEHLKQRKASYLVGRYRYSHTGKGMALNDKEGFVKILVDKKSRKILGCHILGTDASTLIHEVIIAMRHGLTVDDIAHTIHIHPALSEVVERACLQVG